MSTLTLSINDFMLLGPEAHRTAVKLFTAEINHLRRLRQLDAPGSPDDLAHRTRHDQLVSLVKVHQGRLNELEADIAQAAETDGSTVAIAA